MSGEGSRSDAARPAAGRRPGRADRIPTTTLGLCNRQDSDQDSPARHESWQCEYISKDRSRRARAPPEGQARPGRGLRLGRVRQLRRRLAGSVLRRERRVKVTPRLTEPPRRSRPPIIYGRRPRPPREKHSLGATSGATRIGATSSQASPIARAASGPLRSRRCRRSAGERRPCVRSGARRRGSSPRRSGGRRSHRPRCSRSSRGRFRADRPHHAAHRTGRGRPRARTR